MRHFITIGYGKLTLWKQRYLITIRNGKYAVTKIGNKLRHQKISFPDFLVAPLGIRTIGILSKNLEINEISLDVNIIKNENLQ